jgi:DHA1 family inner membrane transport protein
MALPADVALYLLLPMYAAQFGIGLAEAGLLLAANRLVRIAGYGWVARFYARHGDRLTCTLAVAAAAACALGYATLSGFWALLPLRLVWGLCFAALNLACQALATAVPVGAARRSGRSRSVIAIGPMLALPMAAWLAYLHGPRPVFFGFALVALAALPVTRRLPAQAHPAAAAPRRWKLPDSLDSWSFLEGLTLDGLFIFGLSYLGKDLLPAGTLVGGAVMVAGLLLALRYLAEIVLSPIGGHMAERFGAESLLVGLSLLTALALAGFGAGWLGACAAMIVVLRALQLPLMAPIVAHRTPGPGRVQALAARSVWRDIGAGTGPVLAGLLLPVAPPLAIFGTAGALLGCAALACARDSSRNGHRDRARDRDPKRSQTTSGTSE